MKLEITLTLPIHLVIKTEERENGLHLSKNPRERKQIYSVFNIAVQILYEP